MSAAATSQAETAEPLSVALDDGRRAFCANADGWAWRRGEGEWKREPWRANVTVFNTLSRGALNGQWQVKVVRHAVKGRVSEKTLLRIETDADTAGVVARRAEVWRRASVEQLNADPTDPSRCPTCNYDRRGLPREAGAPPPACPECGHQPDGKTLYIFGRSDLNDQSSSGMTGRQQFVAMMWGVPIMLIVLLWSSRLGHRLLANISSGWLSTMLVVIVLSAAVGSATAFVRQRWRTTILPDLLVLSPNHAAVRMLGVGPTRRSRRAIRRWQVEGVTSAAQLWLLTRPIRRGHFEWDQGFAFYFEASGDVASLVRRRVEQVIA